MIYVVVCLVAWLVCVPFTDMHWTGHVLFSVVLLWLLPGAVVSDTALVLAVAWGATEFCYLFTGNKWPTDFYRRLDLLSAALISREPGTRKWLIIAAYPVEWLAYDHPVVRLGWWQGYWLVLTQFIIAGPWPAINRIGKKVLPSPRLVSKVRRGLPMVLPPYAVSFVVDAWLTVISRYRLVAMGRGRRDAAIQVYFGRMWVSYASSFKFLFAWWAFSFLAIAQRSGAGHRPCFAHNRTKGRRLLWRGS
jgi:hypothetical protein